MEGKDCVLKSKTSNLALYWSNQYYCWLRQIDSLIHPLDMKFNTDISFMSPRRIVFENRISLYWSRILFAGCIICEIATLVSATD